MSFRLTPKRKQILTVLKSRTAALTAADIHSTLPEIDLVTIYRTLDLFVKEKLIKKIHLRGTEAQYEYQPSPHHHAVCTTCDRVIHFDLTNVDISKLIALSNFSIDDIDVTIRGTCTNKHR